MDKFLDFCDFWHLADPTRHGGNGLYYHPCCDVWTTRNAKAKRASHLKQLKWRQIAASLDRSVDDKKSALLAKMKEEGWRVPILINQLCSARPKSSADPQLPFRPVGSHHLQMDIQTALAPPKFRSSLPFGPFQHHKGMKYLTRHSE